MSPFLVAFVAMGVCVLFFVVSILATIRRRVRQATAEYGPPGAADGVEGQLVTRTSEARIVEARRGARSVSHQGQRWLELVMDVEVEPDFGAPFPAQVKLMASQPQVQLLTAGARLRVRYPENAGAGASVWAEAIAQQDKGDWVEVDMSAPMDVASTAMRVTVVIAVFAILIALLGLGLAVFAFL